jgi:pimeloyl-ACP methyl ester carboxylesterase
VNRRLAPGAIYPAGRPDVRSHGLRLPSGTRVRVVEAGHESAPALLCVHGWGGCAYTFRHQLEAFSARGWRVIAPDLKGHGLSDKPTARGEYTRPAMLRHLLEIMDALALERVPIIGHSMGCSLAVEIARVAPGRVARMALLAPAGFCEPGLLWLVRAISPRLVRPLLPYMVPRWVVAGILKLAYGHLARPSERDIDEYWAPAAFPGYAIAARDLLHDFAWSPYHADELRAIATPALVVFGTDDRIFQAGRAEQLAREMPDVRVLTLEGVGHIVPEETPAPVNRELASFLDAR